MLAGCTSSKEASKSNFERVINAHFQTHCLEVNPVTDYSNQIAHYPAHFILRESETDPESARQQNHTTTAPFDALMKAGMLTVVDGRDEEIDRPDKTFRPTEAGEKARSWYGGEKTVSFCAGHLKVEQIVMFSAPTAANGITMSQVTFTTSATDVPTWATSKEMIDAIPDFVAQRSTGYKRQLVLVLMNDGWLVDGDQML